MNTKTLLIVGAVALAGWWYLRTNRRRLAIKNTAMAGLGCNCNQPLGTMYSEDVITGPYGEANLYGNSGVVANRQGIWDRMADASSL